MSHRLPPPRSAVPTQALLHAGLVGGIVGGLLSSLFLMGLRVLWALASGGAP